MAVTRSRASLALAGPPVTWRFPTLHESLELDSLGQPDGSIPEEPQDQWEPQQLGRDELLAQHQWEQQGTSHQQLRNNQQWVLQETASYQQESQQHTVHEGNQEWKQRNEHQYNQYAMQYHHENQKWDEQGIYGRSYQTSQGQEYGQVNQQWLPQPQQTQYYQHQQWIKQSQQGYHDIDKQYQPQTWEIQNPLQQIDKQVLEADQQLEWKQTHEALQEFEDQLLEHQDEHWELSQSSIQQAQLPQGNWEEVDPPLEYQQLDTLPIGDLDKWKNGDGDVKKSLEDVGQWKVVDGKANSTQWDVRNEELSNSSDLTQWALGNENVGKAIGDASQRNLYNEEVTGSARELDQWKVPDRVSTPVSDTDQWKLNKEATRSVLGTDQWKVRDRVENPAEDLDQWQNHDTECSRWDLEDNYLETVKEEEQTEPCEVQDEQGRMFCVVAAHRHNASTSPSSSKGGRPMLQLVGVTLDSSSDDVSVTSGRGLQRHRKDLSMDSGIQGSSFDLAETSPSGSSGSDGEEPADTDPASHQVPEDSISDFRVQPPSVDSSELPHGETFNLVEEVYVVEDSRGELLAKATAFVAPAAPTEETIPVPKDNTDAAAMDLPAGVETASKESEHFVVVAIDFGTTYSGYAFCFTRDPETNIHMMRKWEGGDPGLYNQKTPTTLLLTPDEEFHSFGFAARDFFHDLEIQEAKKWLYFDKFKMALHHDQDMNRDTKVRAANGHALPAFTVFAHALHHLKSQALQELSDQTGTAIASEDIRWVITVPAIWRQPAKQFIREAAYQAGICEPEHPEGLLIALEPEAASICCRKLRLNQLIPERPPEQERRMVWSPGSTTSLPILDNMGSGLVFEDSKEGMRYMVVDCGGGTVDITVHELSENSGTLRELHKATGGPWGSMGVDTEFENLLADIFGEDFLTQFKLKRPAAYVELLVSFEARKRSANPHRDSSLNIFPPFAFIDYYRKFKGKEIEQAVRKYGSKDVTWSSQGTLRLQPNVMRDLFKPTVEKILQYIQDVLESPRVHGINFLFLVGGFAESQILQHEIRQAFSDRVRVVIPQGVSLTILRGAVLFGLEPGIVTVRRSKHTYGVGVLKHFIPDVHPPDKLVEKDGIEWCADVLDKFVVAEQSVTIGETVIRRYTPAKPSQTAIVINIYCADSDEAQFITDPGVQRCGTLNLDLSTLPEDKQLNNNRREIHTRMVFGGTEVTASALDIASGNCVHVDVDFLTIQ